jgi:vancomycin permeability regulator SanA
VGALRRHPVLLTLGAVAGLGALVLGLTAWAVWRAAHTDDASRIDRADVILVLGAAQYDGDPSPVFQGRLEHAALLYREGRSETVLVLGGTAAGDRISEAEAGRDWLVASEGLPAGAVVASPVGSTTLESLEAAAGWMRERDLESAFLVSDPWHNLRVKRMASDLGIEAYASATWHSAARSEGTRLGGYVRETFAYLAYRVLGQ